MLPRVVDFFFVKPEIFTNLRVLTTEKSLTTCFLIMLIGALGFNMKGILEYVQSTLALMQDLYRFFSKCTPLIKILRDLRLLWENFSLEVRTRFPDRHGSQVANN